MKKTFYCRNSQRVNFSSILFDVVMASRSHDILFTRTLKPLTLILSCHPTLLKSQILSCCKLHIFLLLHFFFSLSSFLSFVTPSTSLLLLSSLPHMLVFTSLPFSRIPFILYSLLFPLSHLILSLSYNPSL